MMLKTCLDLKHKTSPWIKLTYIALFVCYKTCSNTDVLNMLNIYYCPVLNKMDLRKRKITLDFQFKISRWFLVSTYFTGTAYCPHNDLDTDLDLQHLSCRELVGDVYGVGLGPGQPQGLCSLSREVLEWNDAHPHQVTAVDTLVALGNHRLDSLL